MDMVEILRLHFFLISLSVVEVVEVGNNDRHRKRDRQHTGNGTQGPYYFSPHTYWPVEVINHRGRSRRQRRKRRGIIISDIWQKSFTRRLKKEYDDYKNNEKNMGC